MTKTAAPKLSVVIRDSEKVLAETEAKAVTSFNHLGIFDVLPEHANFISIIENQVIVHERSGEKRSFNINRGVLKVLQNKVEVFIQTISQTASV